MSDYTSYNRQLTESTTPVDDMYIALGQSPPNPFDKFWSGIDVVYLRPTSGFFPYYVYKPLKLKHIPSWCSEQPFSKTFKLVKSR